MQSLAVWDGQRAHELLEAAQARLDRISGQPSRLAQSSIDPELVARDLTAFGVKT